MKPHQLLTTSILTIALLVPLMVTLTSCLSDSPSAQPTATNHSSPEPATPTPSLSDREILEILYDATGGPHWTHTGWLDDRLPLSYWHGISTNPQGRVTHIQLSNNNLTGTIPPEFGNLSELQTISLNYNQLTGPIPPELGKLSELQILYLNSNQLTGTLPHNLTELRLEALTFNDNSGLCAPISEPFPQWLKAINDTAGPSCPTDP